MCAYMYILIKQRLLRNHQILMQIFCWVLYQACFLRKAGIPNGILKQLFSTQRVENIFQSMHRKYLVKMLVYNIIVLILSVNTKYIFKKSDIGSHNKVSWICCAI